MASVVVLPRGPAGSQTARKIAPLLMLVVGLILSLIVLPSALNLPQTNPSTTLEYAPVAPEDNEPPPPAGNFSSFGLGRSSSLDTGGAPGGDGDGAALPDLAAPPSEDDRKPGKRCVQTPRGPKQTEDPLAPPCVPTFDCRENGGATYQGVTKDEIKLLFYFDSGIVDINTAKGDETRPQNKYIDLDQPAEPDEHVYGRMLRGWQRYFEDRYQTYCRRPHFFVYYGSDSDASPEAKRADAADNFAKIKPFAVVTNSVANNDAYLEAMAKRGVLNFGSFIGREASFFNRYPKLVWGYAPPLETAAEQYVTFFCKQIKPYNTTFTGPALLNKPRRYGLVWANDVKHPELRKMKDLVMSGIASRCPISQPGGIPEATWTDCCYAENNGQVPTYASDGMAKFSDPAQAGGPVTTIIWPAGMESKFSDQAFARNYFPEWVLLGEGTVDGYVATQYQNPQVFNGHAWVVSYQTRQIDREKEPCFLALKDADPAAPDQDVSSRGCRLYENLRQLFIGIQVAGPKLGPTSVDKGMHAIPKISSEDPKVPACFYNAGDYSCVKDATAMWWDSNPTPPNGSDPGCWRMLDEGKRYITGQWPDREIQTMKKASDPCNGFRGQTILYLAA